MINLLKYANLVKVFGKKGNVSLNQNEKDFYKKGGKLDQEKLKKKMERMEKQAPKF